MVGALVATMIDIKFLWYQRLAMWHWICKTISIWYYLKSYSLGSSRCLLVVRKEKYDPTRAIFIVLLVCGFICIVCDFEIRESQKWVENWYWLVTENFVRNWKKVQKWLWDLKRISTRYLYYQKMALKHTDKSSYCHRFVKRFCGTMRSFRRYTY